MNDNPLVSVLLPFYNSERYLKASIESILNQTYPYFELLLLDDGSSDSCLVVAQRISAHDSRVKIYSHPNMGLCRTLQKGVSLVKGKYIARMDADDIAEPNRFELQVKYLELNPDCVALGTALTIIDPDGDVLDKPPITQDHNQLVKELLQWQGARICHPTVMMRTEQVRAVGGYTQEYHFEDIDLFLKLSKHGKLANLAERLVQYRWHIDSISHTRTQAKIHEIKRQIISQASTKLNLPLGISDKPQRLSNNSELISTKVVVYSPQYEAYCRWCIISYKAGFYKTSLKYLWKVFQIKPFSPKTSWIVINLFLGQKLGNTVWNALLSIKCKFQELTALKRI